MLEVVTLVVALAILTLLIIALVRGLPSRGHLDVANQIAEQEKRLREELDRTRQQVEALLREAAAASQRELREQAVASANQQAATRQDLLALINERSKDLQREIGQSLMDGRRSQDERLDRLDASLAMFKEALIKDMAVQKEVITSLQTSVVERQATFAQEIMKLLKEQVEKLTTTTSSALITITSTLKEESAGQQSSMQPAGPAGEGADGFHREGVQAAGRGDHEAVYSNQFVCE